VIFINAGVLGRLLARPSITRNTVAQAVGADLNELAQAGDRGRAMATMAVGATAIVLDLYEQGRLHGILGLGGSGGTSLVTRMM